MTVVEAVRDSGGVGDTEPVPVAAPVAVQGADADGLAVSRSERVPTPDEEDVTEAQEDAREDSVRVGEFDVDGDADTESTTVGVGNDELVACDALAEPDAVVNADDVPRCDIVSVTDPLPDTLADVETAAVAVEHALVAAEALEHCDACGDADGLPLVDAQAVGIVLIE